MNNSDETWLAVLGWEGYYEVSSAGRIRSKVRLCRATYGWRKYGGGEVTPIPGTRGYLVVNLSRPGTRKQVFLHKLVLEAFVGPCPEGLEACHDNGVRHDCRRNNLRWDTRSANHQDKKRHGTAQIGERANNVKLSEAVVREIRQRGLTPSEAVREFGLSKTNAARIVRGETWRHVHE